MVAQNYRDLTLREAETQIIIADALKYLKTHETEDLMPMAADVGRLINGLVKSLNIRPA